MDAPLTTASAVLLALRGGPGYGLDLVRRVKATAGVRLASGSVHRALRRLHRAGRVRRWTVVPGRRRGARARVYYELTARGIVRADAQAETLRAFLAPPVDKLAAREVAAMRRRLREAADVSAFVADLQGRLAKTRRNAP